MAAFTYAPGAVLRDDTGELAVGAAGLLRTPDDHQPVQVYDLNDSPIPHIAVGMLGAYQAFKADIPDGLLDFGSVLIPVVSQESHRAGLEAITVAQGAVEQATAAAQAAQEAAESAAQAESIFIVHGSDPSVARPGRDTALVWIGSVFPVNADPARDQWLAATSLQVVPPA